MALLQHPTFSFPKQPEVCESIPPMEPTLRMTHRKLQVRNLAAYEVVLLPSIASLFRVKKGGSHPQARMDPLTSLASAMPVLLILYWGLASGASAIALIPLPFAQGLRCTRNGTAKCHLPCNPNPSIHTSYLN